MKVELTRPVFNFLWFTYLCIFHYIPHICACRTPVSCRARTH